MTSPHPRPLSPHLQVYHWYFTMFLSILHRATGVALSAGLVLVTGWLLALAGGPESFGGFRVILSSLPAQVVLFGFVFALSFHFLNGIRHLVWDCGYNIGRQSAYISGVITFAGSVVLTLFIWHLAGGI